MKTKILGYSGLVVILLTSVLWMSQGCVGGVPPIVAFVVTSTPTLPSDVISNFNSGSITVNPKLQNTNGLPGYWTVNTYGGGIYPNSINSPFLLANPGNGSNFAIHLICGLSDAGGNEADQLNCYLKSDPTNPYFDATPFTGIQFDMRLGSADTNSSRSLSFPIDLTMSGVPGGICTANCYNGHMVSLPTSPTNTWHTVSFNWSQFQRPSWMPVPYQYLPFSAHLNKILFMQFSFGDGGGVGSAGTPNVTQTDIWIDNVKFLP